VKDLRSQDPNARRSPPEMRRNNSSLRRLKGNNRESTAGVLQLRWRVLTPVRGV